jgi:hypothetical protein
MNDADAPDSRTAISPRELNILLVSHPSGPCWSGNFYLGSMFVLDFGDRLLVHRPRGPVYQGTTSLGIRDCYWEMLRGIDIAISAEIVDREAFNNIVTPMMRGQQINQIEPDAREGFVRVSFSNDIAIDLDITNRWDADGAIAEIGLSNGAYVAILPSGQLQISKDRDLLRLHEHERRSHQ